MHGTITFTSLDDLANFLKEFCPSTALFEVHEDKTRDGSPTGSYTLEFTGGY